MKGKKIDNSQKGITIVSLVVTVITLLIVLGVTVTIALR